MPRITKSRGGARTMKQKEKKKRSKRHTLRRRHLPLVFQHRFRRNYTESFLDDSYSNQVAEAIEENGYEFVREFEEELENLGVLPRDRSILEYSNLQKIQHAIEELDMTMFAQNAVARHEQAAGRPVSNNLRNNIQSVKEERKRLHDEYELLENMQILQDSILSQPIITHGRYGKIMYIDITIFDKSMFYYNAYGANRANSNEYDLRFEVSLGKRFTQGRLLYSPLLRKNSLNTRILSKIPKASLRILYDNLFPRIWALLHKVEGPIYLKLRAEAEAARRRPPSPSPPPPAANEGPIVNFVPPNSGNESNY
jgi:hypothetical protein